MSATAISAPGIVPEARCVLHRREDAWIWALSCYLFVVGPIPGLAQPSPITLAPEIARAERLYTDAQTQLGSAQTNTTFAWQFARAAFERAEFATNNAERALLAEQGIAACRRALPLKPDSAALHYYLAMNLGQLARTKTLGALRLVGEMETEFKAARRLDEQLDFSGPDRNLGRLYFEAPGWPTSIGNRTKARLHMRRAAELAPQYPENRLNLVEAYLRWGDRSGAVRELKELEAVWPIAVTNLTGEAWIAAWAEWQTRLNRAKKLLEAEVKTLTSPSQRH